MLVTLVAVEFEMATVVAVFVTYSPTLPAFALLFVVVPTIPFVCEGVKLPVDESVVKLPAAGVVPPITALSIVPPVIVGLFPKAGKLPVTPNSICPVVPAPICAIAEVPLPDKMA